MFSPDCLRMVEEKLMFRTKYLLIALSCTALICLIFFNSGAYKDNFEVVAKVCGLLSLASWLERTKQI